MSDQQVNQIVIDIQHCFATFGGVKKAGLSSNPLDHWTEGEPATFALGVSVEHVVRFVADAVKPKQKRRKARAR